MQLSRCAWGVCVQFCRESLANDWHNMEKTIEKKRYPLL